MARGERADGSDAVAHARCPEGDGWDVRLVVAITGAGPKAIGSTAAMDAHRRAPRRSTRAWIALGRAPI